MVGGSHNVFHPQLFINEVQIAAENCTPLSEVMQEGSPKCASQPAKFYNLMWLKALNLNPKLSNYAIFTK
jgi:hypothetical protein